MSRDTFIFRPLKSFVNMFADLTKLVPFVIASELQERACVIGLAGYLILSWTSCSVVSSWNPVTTAVFLFWFSCELLPGGDLLIHSVVFIVVFFLHFINCRVRSS